MIAVGAWLALTHAAPVGGGCSSTRGGPIVCTSGHQSGTFTLGVLIQLSGLLLGLVGAYGLRTVPQWWRSLWGMEPSNLG